MNNWKTTLLGLLAVVVQAVLQAISSGQVKLPELAPTAIIAIGLKQAKDASSKD